MLTSPIITLNKTNIKFNFQNKYQIINTKTNHRKLLKNIQPFKPLPNNKNNNNNNSKSQTNLNHFQNIISLKYPLTI